MLEPHTATFPCGSFSRKSGAAVAFQNLDPSIKQHPWFTPHNTHTHTPSSVPPPFSPPSLLSPSPCILISLSCPSPLFFSLSSSLPLSIHPSLFAPFIHPSLSQTGFTPPQATSARLSATDLLIGLSPSAVNTKLVSGVVSQAPMDSHLTPDIS